MQVQHRLISGTTAFPWRYLGEGGPGNYNYGIVKVNGFQDPMDLNATHLPTRVQFRYRLLHKDFPGKQIKVLMIKKNGTIKTLQLDGIIKITISQLIITLMVIIHRISTIWNH